MGAACLTPVREVLPEQGEQGVRHGHDGKRDGGGVEHAERREQRTGEVQRAGELFELRCRWFSDGRHEPGEGGDDEAGGMGVPVEHVGAPSVIVDHEGAAPGERGHREWVWGDGRKRPPRRVGRRTAAIAG